MTLFKKLIKKNNKKLWYITFYSLAFLLSLTISIFWYNILFLICTICCGIMLIIYLYSFFIEKWWLLKNKKLLKKI